MLIQLIERSHHCDCDKGCAEKVFEGRFYKTYDKIWFLGMDGGMDEKEATIKRNNFAF
jgi:hypothetical protein